MILPEEKVKLVLVDKKISKLAVKTLNDFGVEVIQTTEVRNISDCTSTHPDMQFLMYEKNKALVEKSTYGYYRRLLPMFELVPVDNIKSPYPNDSFLNVTHLGETCFLTKSQDEKIGKYFKTEKIYVKQGYTKCNICALNRNAIISSDPGIIKKAQFFGFKTYFLPSDEIVLNDYKNGFWGGCTGLLDENVLFINGDINSLDCKDKLFEILDKEKIEPLYYFGEKVTDNGSIIPLI